MATCALQSLVYTPAGAKGNAGPTLQVLDQLLIPREKAYIDVKTIQDAWKVIRDMNVRGAPLIAIVAVLGMGVDISAQAGGFKGASQAEGWVKEAADYLRTSRPTAVNLFTAMDEVVALAAVVAGQAGAEAGAVVSAVVAYAERLLKEDVETNKAIGDHGANAILANAPGRSVRVMTHCNTGSLATAGYGTALGVIRSLQAAGRLERVYCTETRPYNQGARLTAFELVQDKLPGTLITDSMASFLMATKGLDAVVVGADRIAANGDTANKIGTYQLAVACKHHGVAFYVAAPFTSFDLALASGKQIVIEERPPQELTHVQGLQVAPEGIAVWNPGFDVTPAALITGGIITEKGVIRPTVRPAGKGNEEEGQEEVFFDVAGFLQGEGGHRGPVDVAADGGSVVPQPLAYQAMESGRLAQFLRFHVPQVWARLGAQGPGDLAITEVGDGNLNLVFVVQGPKDTVIVKQALPYVRCVGESWPLTLDRAFYENAALEEEFKHTPALVPQVFYFSKALALIVMRYVEPPHLILRKALIRGDALPTLAADLAEFMARNLFFTSSLHLTGPEKREKVAFWSGNHGLCALTEAVVFTEPYLDVAHNRWTSPQLDGEVKALRGDVALKLAVGKLKAKFMDAAEALLHGDLHTGSVMVKPGSTFVIDPEFAFYGPMGFEVGALLANFLLAYFSQPGHPGNGAAYADWVLEQFVAIWEGFAARFLALWADEASHKGELYKRAAYPSQTELAATQEHFLQGLLADTLGFAGCKMIRRIIGIAHVEDLESIGDADLRAACERRALATARELVVNAAGYASIRDVAALARRHYAEGQ